MCKLRCVCKPVVPGEPLIQNSCVTMSAPYVTRLKRPERETDNSSPWSVGINNSWRYASNVRCVSLLRGY
jgi:hypothetical protein